MRRNTRVLEAPHCTCLPVLRLKPQHLAAAQTDADNGKTLKLLARRKMRLIVGIGDRGTRFGTMAVGLTRARGERIPSRTRDIVAVMHDGAALETKLKLVLIRPSKNGDIGAVKDVVDFLRANVAMDFKHGRRALKETQDHGSQRRMSVRGDRCELSVTQRAIVSAK